MRPWPRCSNENQCQYADRRIRLVVACLGCLVAPHAASASDPVRIGLAVASLQNDVFNQIAQSIEAFAKQKGVTLDVLDAQDDAATQASQVQDLVNHKIQVLIDIPAGASPADLPVKLARAAGIPVIAVDRNPVNASADTFIGTDQIAGAKALGDYACTATGGKAELEIIESTLHTRHEDDRNKGFTEAMKHCPGINEADRDWTHRSAPDEGFRYAKTALMQNPQISLIFGRVDTLALGAARAVEAAHLDHKVFVIGFDGDLAGLQAVKEGKIDATMTQPTHLMGKLAFQAAMDLFAGSKVPPEQIQSAVLTTSANVDQLLALHP